MEIVTVLLRDGKFSQSACTKVVRKRSTKSARNVPLVVAVANARLCKAVLALCEKNVVKRSAEQEPRGMHSGCEVERLWSKADGNRMC